MIYGRARGHDQYVLTSKPWSYECPLGLSFKALSPLLKRPFDQQGRHAAPLVVSENWGISVLAQVDK